MPWPVKVCVQKKRKETLWKEDQRTIEGYEGKRKKNKKNTSSVIYEKISHVGDVRD